MLRLAYDDLHTAGEPVRILTVFAGSDTVKNTVKEE